LEKYSKEAAESRYEHRLGGFGQWIKCIRIAGCVLIAEHCIVEPSYIQNQLGL
jgi:hypothetical protein